VHRRLRRKDKIIWPRESRDCDKAISRQLVDSVGHRGLASGVQVARSPRYLTTRSPKVFVLGFASCEVRSLAETKGR
jgi:hypothetical protein